MFVDWELGLRNFKFCMISSHTMAYARRRALEKARKRHEHAAKILRRKILPPRVF